MSGLPDICILCPRAAGWVDIYKASGNYSPTFVHYAIPNFSQKMDHYAHYYSFYAPHCYDYSAL